LTSNTHRAILEMPSGAGRNEDMTRIAASFAVASATSVALLCAAPSCSLVAAYGDVPGGASGTSGQGGTTGSGGQGGIGASGGQGGSTPSECVPSENPDAVGDACGLFVALEGDDGYPGTRAQPMRTIAGALAAAAQLPLGRIYACTERFDEAVAIGGRVELYGGLDCQHGWTYVGPSGGPGTELHAPTAQVAVTIGPSGSDTRVEDVTVVGGDGGVAGASSVAMLVDRATGVELTRCTLQAGAGMLGAAGASLDGTGTTGIIGDPGGAGCVDGLPVAGGTSAILHCGGVASSAGGAGGLGELETGGNGFDGVAFPLPAVMASNGGAGQAIAACGNGTAGASGDDGPNGAGATALGWLGPEGYVAPSAAAGDAGTPGQGGGGGGGRHSSASCGSSAYAGPSGGSGGTGGCGGAGGGAGGAGGSSIALVSLAAGVALTNCALQTAAGAPGGNGGNGQAGGAGKEGGPGGTSSIGSACAGGIGGVGGVGGGGGGGRGGHSVGVAYTGTAPVVSGCSFALGEAGIGGTGGTGSAQSPPGDGEPGIAINVQEFPTLP
jgi:hypothetical protein